MVEVLTSAPARAGAILDSPVGAPPGLVFAFRLKADGTAEELAVDRPIADDPHCWLWLHFNLTDARAGHFLPRRASCSLPPTTTNSSMRARPVCLASFPTSFAG